MPPFTRRQFLTTSAAGTAAALSASCSNEREVPTRPNVLLIYTDDHNRAQLGCYDGWQHTPHMDSLARDGMRFTRFYATSPVCGASRFNVLSGRYASRAASMQRYYPPPGPVNIGQEPCIFGEEDSLPLRLRAAGYRTGMVGKWHQGGPVTRHRFRGDENPADPAIKQQMEENYAALVSCIKSTGFDHVASAYAGNVGDKARDSEHPYWLPRALQCHNQEWLTQGALDFIESDTGQPFFLYMALTGPHGPSLSQSMFDFDTRATPAGFLPEPLNCQPPREDAQRRAIEAKKSFEKARGEACPDWAFVPGQTWLDDGVGAVLAKLEERGLADNTLVLLASDNGSKGKFTCYEQGGRVPFLARWRGVIPTGRVCRDLVCSVDIPTTILSLCGAMTPPSPPLDGVDLREALLDSGGYRRDSIFMEITQERAVVSRDGWKYIAVRGPEALLAGITARTLNHWGRPLDDHSYRALEYPGYFSLDQLYDLNTDPDEGRNLAAESSHRTRLLDMQALLREYSAKLPHDFGEFSRG